MPKRRGDRSEPDDPLAPFHEPVRRWFAGSFPEPTPAQRQGWPPIARGESTLLLAPTGSGKTLAAFLAAIDRLMFSPEPAKAERCRVLYVSPLKALAVDVERNLRAPLAGIRAVASREGVAHREVAIGLRTGDTPASERARLRRTPADILITTPESLYLLLTSAARETLRWVETVIVDEIHSLVPTKRGVHLFLSLERLERLRVSGLPPLQRIGLSATQRPLQEVARLLGGGTPSAEGEWTPRPVAIVDAGSRRPLELRVEVPVEDMARLGEPSDEIPSGPASARPGRASIWPSMHPRLVELIRAHRSTMIFVNSRRLAERLAGALNELAGEELALAHHGSVARDRRAQIEDALKRGELRAIVATSSLELGIDMGAVDLVVQVEAPPSVASGLQRIGRARHEVGGTPRGVIFPKYRGDLLACAATTRRMVEGLVEETFYPRNPLDVLAQQVVAAVASGVLRADELFDLVRSAAPFAELPRAAFDGVLDMLSGRYPSDEFAELRPRLTWDRISGALRAREGAARLAVVNAGTIPDRGLYGVFLPGEGDKPGRRVGELDEEMVFESRTGDVFLLGATSWRIEEITHDRVIVSPAPGEPGKMPFWHGDRAGRPAELGRALGALVREIAAGCARGDAGRRAAASVLRERHFLDEKAALNAVAYACDQAEATGEVPSDRVIVLERCLDEIGDWRACVLTPFGARFHAPWATAVQARLREELDAEVEAIWSDDGMVFRMPAADTAPAVESFFPAADEIEDLVVRSLGGSALFASRFRENAARALLLPRRHPGKRSPLWAQRKRSADLLQVASRYGSFPILLETYRECLRDVFDLPALQEILRDVGSRRLRVHVVDTKLPSPFAASLMFAYVASFIYDGDAPLAERRAHALSVDQAQLRELLGDAELRELLDPEAIESVERALQRLGSGRARHADALHDLLLHLGDRSLDALRERSEDAAAVEGWLAALRQERRVLAVRIQDEERFIAAEDAGRYRDALGLVIPPGLPEAFLEGVPDPLLDLVSRHARTHGPFRAADCARRWGLGEGVVRATLRRLADAGRVLEGDFLPGGRDLEACDAEVLRQIKRRSLARLRAQVEPVGHDAFGRFALDWQGIAHPRAGLDGLLSAIEQLQGAPLLASVLEAEILPARVLRYLSTDLDALCMAGEVAWRGLEPVGPHDGRIALYLTDHAPLLAPPPRRADGDLASVVREHLAARGALFFADLHAATGAFAGDLVAALWDMTWAGEVTNDTLAPLRSFLRGAASKRRDERPALCGRSFRSRRLGPPGSEGRWSLVRAPVVPPSETERRAALAQSLLERHGIVVREIAQAEGLQGGFSAVYPILKAMEESGRVRRGYFVEGLGGAQFAMPGAEDRLRNVREPADEPRGVVLSSTDPASLSGAAVPWPQSPHGRLERRAGSQVVLVDGALRGYLNRTQRELVTFLPDDPADRARAARGIVQALAALVETGRRRALLVASVDGVEPSQSALAPYLAEAGFLPSLRGHLKRGAPLVRRR